MARFRIHRATSMQPIYDRHPGPWRLHITFKGDVRPKQRWEKRHYLRWQDCDRAARGYLEEEEVASVSVWSDHCGYWLTTYDERTPSLEE